MTNNVICCKDEKWRAKTDLTLDVLEMALKYGGRQYDIGKEMYSNGNLIVRIREDWNERSIRRKEDRIVKTYTNQKLGDREATGLHSRRRREK